MEGTHKLSEEGLMRHSTLFMRPLLTVLIVGSAVFSCSSGKSAGTDNVSAPVPIKVYSAEKGDYIMSETVVKSNEE
jgi:hypothetical protein